MQLLIADKSELIIQRLEELLSASDILVNDRALTYEEAKLCVKKNNPDVVVVDLNFPGNSSYQLLKELKESSPRTVVIVLSFRLDEYILQQCMDLGADFFLDKYYEYEQVPVILNAIAQNKLSVYELNKKNQIIAKTGKTSA